MKNAAVDRFAESKLVAGADDGFLTAEHLELPVAVKRSVCDPLAHRLCQHQRVLCGSAWGKNLLAGRANEEELEALQAV